MFSTAEYSGMEARSQLEQRRDAAVDGDAGPLSGVRMRASIFSSVDLPAPFGPITPRAWPCGTVNERLSAAHSSSHSPRRPRRIVSLRVVSLRR